MLPERNAATEARPGAAVEQHVLMRTLATDLMGPARLREFELLLQDDERARADRLVNRHDRRDWIAARGLLRELAGQYLRQPGKTLVFGRNEHGKPFLVLPGGASHHIDISVSHTRGLVACAIATGCRVGVDAEKIDDRSHEEVAGNLLSPDEARWLAGCPAHRARVEFLRLWTLKEAVAKAHGSGLALDFREFSVLPDPPRLHRGSPELGEAALWRLAQWRPSDRHVVALAYRRVNDMPCSLDVLHID